MIAYASAKQISCGGDLRRGDGTSLSHCNGTCWSLTRVVPRALIDDPEARGFLCAWGVPNLGFSEAALMKHLDGKLTEA